MSFAKAFGPPSGAPPPETANSEFAGNYEDQQMFMVDDDMRDAHFDQPHTPLESAEQIPSQASQDDINHYAEMLRQMKNELGSQGDSHFENGEHGGGIGDDDDDDDDDDEDDSELRDDNNDKGSNSTTNTTTTPSSTAKNREKRNKYVNEDDREFQKNVKMSYESGGMGKRHVSEPLVRKMMTNSSVLEPANFLIRPGRVLSPHDQYNEYPCCPWCKKGKVMYPGQIACSGWKQSSIPIYCFNDTGEFDG